MNSEADKSAPLHAVRISVTCTVPRARINSRLIHTIVRDALEHWFTTNAAMVNIAIVTANQIARLNQQYLRHDGPTDVIAFEYSPGELMQLTATVDAPEIQKSRPIFGDLFVCLDIARQQATLYRTTWQKELIRYVVHGLLHLAGYTDSTTKARRRMKRQEDKLMRWISQRHDLTKIHRQL